MTSSLMTAQVTLSGFIMCNLSYGGAFLPVFILLLLILSIFFFSLPRSPFSNCVRRCIDINPCCILSLPAFECNINSRNDCLPRSTKCKLICRSNTAVKSDILLVLYSQRIVKENESHTDFLISPTPFFFLPSRTAVVAGSEWSRRPCGWLRKSVYLPPSCCEGHAAPSPPRRPHALSVARSLSLTGIGQNSRRHTQCECV